MGPDRVLALGAATRGLVLAGVDDLEVVDVTVGLVEVAVAVVVVAVPLVELGEFRADLGRGVTAASRSATQALTPSWTAYQAALSPALLDP